MFYPKILLLILMLPFAALADEDADWPCFHGPRRDNISRERGLLQSWPQDGPKLLWTASGLGHGYSSVSIADGRIFTAGMIARQTHVTALDVNGRQIWQRLNGQSWQASRTQTWAVAYAGSRGTPTVDGETLFHLSEMGGLTAFNAATGRQQWSVDVLKTFNAERPKYGLSESVLIYGDALLCCPGGADGYMVALDKKTGKTLWANTQIKDPVGYCSPIVARIGDVEQVISMSAKRIFSIDPKTGRLLWEHPFGNERGNSATDAIVHDGIVYASTGYGGGSISLRPRQLQNRDFSVTVLWKIEALDNHHGGVIRLDRCLYGAGHESRGWFCLDFATGRAHSQTPGKGSLTYADNRLYCLDERGTMTLVKAISEKWETEGSFKVPTGGKGLFWAHPVVCGGRLYVRHSDRLYAYDIRKN